MNTVTFDGNITVVQVDMETFSLHRNAVTGMWYVGNCGRQESYYTAQFAAAEFRYLVESARLAQQKWQRLELEREFWSSRYEEEPPFVLGRVKLEAGDMLPI